MAAPSIGRQRRWAPPHSARIEWSHPLAKGLKFWSVGQYDFVGKRFGTLNATLSVAATPQGRGFTGSSSGYVSWSAGQATNGQAAWSAACFCRVPIRFGSWDGDSALQSWFFEVGTSPAVYAYDGGYPNLAAGSLSTGQWALISTSRDAGGTQYLYIDGRLVGSGSLSQPTSNSNGIQIVNSPDSTNSGTACWGAYWHRALSAAEHAQLRNDPFAAFRW